MEKVKLGDVTINLDFKRKPLNNQDRKKISAKKLYPYCGANKIMDYVDEYIFDEEIICIAEDGGKWGKNEICSYIMNERCWVNNHVHVLKCNEKININYLKYWLNFNDLNYLITGAIVRKLTQKALCNIEIELPDIKKQISIAKKLDKVQDIMDLRKKQIKELDELIKAQFVKLFGNAIMNEKNWKLYKWNDVLVIKNGKNQKNVEDKQGKYPIYGSGGIMNYATDYICNEDSVIIGRKGNINNPILVRSKFWNVDTAFGLEPKRDKIIVEFLFYFCEFYNFEKHNKAVTIPSLTKKDLLNIDIPIPPIELQNQFADIVKQIEKQKFITEKSLKETEELQESLMNKYFV